MSHSRFMRDTATLYPEQAKTAILQPGLGQQLELQTIQLINMGATACDLAVLIKLGVSGGYTVGLVQGGNPAVDVSAAIAAGQTQDLFTTTLGDGFIIQSKSKFSLVGFSATQVDATGAYSYQYWNGSAFVPLPATRNVPVYSATGDKVIFFLPPLEWVPGTSVGVGGEDGLYTLYVASTTAPAAAIQANALWAGRVLSFLPNVGQYGVLSSVWSEKYPRLLDAEEGVLPYFGIANGENTVTVQYFPSR